MLKEINDGYVKTELHNGVSVIEFHHPQSNSLPSKILEQLAQEIHFAGQEPDTKVILLRSAGEKVFCSGASFNELMAITNEQEGAKFFSGFANVINAMRKCSKFIIGRIHGKCIGGGVGLAAACDYAIAVEGADIKLSELAVGIGPFVVGPAIERKTGQAAFGHMAIDATKWRSADWARRKNIYAELHPDNEGMEENIKSLIETLSHSSPEAMAELKKVLWHGTEHWDTLLPQRAAISGRLVLSDYTKNFIKKFKEKQEAKN